MYHRMSHPELSEVFFEIQTFMRKKLKSCTEDLCSLQKYFSTVYRAVVQIFTYVP